MTNVIIAGHRFRDNPSFSVANGEHQVTVAIPFNTERSIISDLQDATEMQVTDPLGNTVIGTYHLVGWRKIETFYDNSEMLYLITWAFPAPDEIEELNRRIEELSTENEDLIEAIIELASYIDDGKT